MKNWNRLSSIASKLMQASFGLLILTIMASGAFAQTGRVALYKVTTPTLTYTDISGTGTTLTTVSTGYGWRGDYFTMSLPFAFPYDGTTYGAGTTLYLSSASLGFGSNAPSYYGTTYGGLGNSTFPSRLYPFGEYYVSMGGGYNAGAPSWGSGIYYQTSGTAPNRVFTVQMNGVHSPGAGHNDGYTAENIQIKIFETTGAIQFIYQTHSKVINPNNYVSGGAIGINGSTSPSFSSLTYASGLTSVPSTDLQFAPPLPPQEFSLTPNPKVLNFGTTTAQNPVTKTATAMSVGAVGTSIHILGYSLSGSSAYAITSAPAIGTVLPVGTSVPFNITFTPLSGGSQVGTLTVITDGSDSGTQIMALNGIGAVPGVNYGASTMFQGTHIELTDTSGVQYLRVASTGSAPLTINSIYFYGLNQNDYFVVHTPINPMAVGTTDSIGVRFAPDIEGLPDAHMVINTTAANNPSDTVTMAGIGILPRLVLNNAYKNIVNLNFDSVKVGVDSCLTVNLVNPGSDTLVITKNFFSSADYDYTLTPLTGSADTLLPGGGSQQIQVCFMPLKPGVRQAVLRITTNIPHTFNVPQRDTSSFSVEITGVGVPYGHLAITGPALEDSTPVGIQKCTTLMDTLWNTGSSTTIVTGAAITGTDSAEFTYSGLTFPVTLAPNTHLAFTVCGDPKVEGNNTAIFTAIDADNSASLPLGIFGTNLCDTLAWVTGFESATCMGTMDTATISVTNCGNIPTTYLASISGTNAGQFAIVSANPSSSENAGGVATFKVAYTPDATDATSAATFNITGGPGGTLPLVAAHSSAVIAGSGAAPTTAVGVTSTPFPVVVTNTGACPWDPGATTGITAGPFTYSSGAAVIPAGGNITMMFTYTPTSSAAVSQQVTFAGATVTLTAPNVTITASSESVSMISSQNGYSIDQSYPNPSTGTSNVEITLPTAGMVHLAILDITGNVVENVLDRQFNEGSYSIKIEANDLASGTYFYSMTSGNVRLTRQMTIVK